MTTVKVAKLALTILAFATVAPARADVNEVQIDWMISKDDWAKAASAGNPRRSDYKMKLLPSHLFTTQDNVVAADGTKLLPAGSQLYALTGPAFAACSQMAAAPGFLGADNRICFRDDDRDGKFDTFWTRRPIKQLLGKDDWFILNDEIPAARARVVAPTLQEVSPEMAEATTDINLRFSLGGKGVVSGAIWVRNGELFTGYCIPMGRSVPNAIDEQCLIPDLIARATNFDSPDKSIRKLEMIPPTRSTPVRFQIRKGMIMGFTVESIRLF